MSLCAGIQTLASASFVNFETAPVHPVDLNPNGQTLTVCNLADGRLEIFDLASGGLIPAGNVPVGIDPVSVRFRTTNEAWVVNHISSSINIVDVAGRQIVATLQTLPGPADVVFAGSPTRAFVSCSRVNAVQVFDPISREPISRVEIDGERPRALAVAPNGSNVYVAIFESGNASTILGPPLGQLNNAPEEPPLSPLEHESGPYGGIVPPPNSGSSFQPPINPDIPTNYPPPKVSHIVKRNSAGRWMDDNLGDWTEFIAGTNAALSSRIEGWSMPDHDVAVIDTASLDVTYVSGLMNLCMALAVNPASGKIAVVGTDGLNEVRFEPNLRSTFLRVRFASIDPVTSAAGLKDLNPHLDYLTRSLPQSERDKSIGDPRGIVWNSGGTRAYVTGMGSRNLIVVDANGDRIARVELSDGPTGLALDEPRGRLYVLNRFSATVAVVDTASNLVITNLSFFDPTPPAIRLGRKHFYDTRVNSGLGHVSCASCHPDGRMDRLAWDLGDPAGPLLTITNIDVLQRSATRTYHPMKGPMVTQTLQDIIGHEPFHWRGDREGIEDFNQTFPALLGRDELLSAEEMAEFKAFLATIHFPPNLARNLDDTLSENVPVGDKSGPFPDEPGYTGNAIAGRADFRSTRDTNCRQCHAGPAGLSPTDILFPPGPRGEEHLELFATLRSDNLLFKGPQLRNLSERTGLDYNSQSSRAGFGFTHDGRADTFSRFLGTVTGLFNDEAEGDLSAFLLSFSGSDPAIQPTVDVDGVASLDVATATGRQLTITNAQMTPALQTLLALGDSPSNRLDLVARGTQNGLRRSWYYAGGFLSDRNGEELSTAGLLSLASPEYPLTLTLVPRGSGLRVGVDRDADGFFDRTEIEAGLDPDDPESRGTNRPPALVLSTNYIAVHPGMSVAFTSLATDPDAGHSLQFSLGPDAPDGATIDPVTGVFQWNVPPGLLSYQAPRIHVRVVDNQWPNLMTSAAVAVEVIPLRVKPLEFETFAVLITWDALPSQVYRLQFSSNVAGPWINWHQTITSGSREGFVWIDRSPATLVPQQYYRVRTEP
jgi:DNA-binding beta-propeller fold protein YncE